MQAVVLQACRRSSRLLQRSAGALPVTRAQHSDAENVAEASDGPKRHRRRAAVSKQSTGSHKESHKETSNRADVEAAADQLKPLGPITNFKDLPAADHDAAAVAEPPTKRPRGRPPRAAKTAAAAAAAAAAPALDEADPRPAAPISTEAADAAGPACDKTAGRVPVASAGASSGKAKGKGSSSKSSGGPTRALEQRLWGQGFSAVAGVDEAGRGPLAGPVVAAAAVLPPGVEFELLNDSKQMSEQDRETVYEQLTTHPDVSYAVAMVDVSTIDTINILQAAMLAMRTAVEGLGAAGLAPDHLLIDGNRKPAGLDDTPVQLVVKGDATVTCIAAASVIAKVTRDRMMLELEQQYPQYGFAQHKGYGVPAHKAAIQRHGPCPEHRRSFEPIKSLTKWPGYPKQPGQLQAATGTVLAAVARHRSTAAAAPVKPGAAMGL